MATFRRADAEADALIAAVMAEQYPELTEAGVTVSSLFAHAPRNANGEPDGPALKHHGWPAMAVVKINSQRDRADGLADARISIDGDEWPNWGDDVRRAVIDHELCHLELRLDAENEDEHGNRPVKLDDCNRPMLKLREHDFEIGGFANIVARHGGIAPEMKAMREALKMVKTWAPDASLNGAAGSHHEGATR